jgi:hypothetical protein
MVERSLPVAARDTRHTIQLAWLIHALSVLVIVVPAIFVSAINLNISYDDAFITYRYAGNLASGVGFVYNAGEWYMGTTAPLYGLLLGGLGWIFGPDAIPLISGFLSGLSLTLTGVALYLYGVLHKQRLCGLLAGLFFVVNPLLPLTFGGEMLFQLALISWAFVAYRLDRNVLAALLLAIAILTRADSIIAAAVIGFHSLAVRRRVPWRELLVVVAVLLPFLLLSWIYYGSLVPGTLGAKLAQRDSGLWPLFARGMIEWVRGFAMQGSSKLYPDLPAAPNVIRYILFVMLGVPALLLFRFWMLPLAWIALYLLGYNLLNVPFYHWYVVPVAFGFMILAAAGVAGVVDIVARVMRHLVNPGRAAWVGPGLGLACLLALGPGIAAQLRYEQQPAVGPTISRQLYEKTGRWLANHTAPGATVGYFEIGYIGYYGQRRMIDPLGLVNPGVAPHIAQREFTWAYEHYRPMYIIQNQLIFVPYVGKVVKAPWFKQEYREVMRIDEPGYPPLIIYERIRLGSGAGEATPDPTKPPQSIAVK